MALSPGYSLVIIGVCAACTFFERALPFLIFGRRPVPPWVRYLGRLLPLAVMVTLVIYCLRSVTFASPAGFVPSLVGAAVTVGLHLWKRSTLLSVVGGTACYVLLVQAVF